MANHMASVFDYVVVEARGEGLLTDTDVRSLTDLIRVLEAPILDLRRELEAQPMYRATIGYYYHLFLRMAKDAESSMEARWLHFYESLHPRKYSKGDSPAGRFSEKLVSSHAAKDSVYSDRARIHAKCSYYAAQMGELREAFSARSRMLEQVSNNARKDLGQEAG